MRSLFFSLSLAGAFSASPITASDLPGSVERGALRVIAGAGEQPEMFSFDADQPPGFEREPCAGVRPGAAWS